MVPSQGPYQPAFAHPFLLGVGLSESAHPTIGRADLAYYNGQTATLTGVVQAEPDVRDTGINYVVAIDHMVEGSHKLSVHGLLELHTAPSQILNEGDQIQLTGPLVKPTNSAAIPYRDILAHRGIFSQMSFPRLFHNRPHLVGCSGRRRPNPDVDRDPDRWRTTRA